MRIPRKIAVVAIAVAFVAAGAGIASATTGSAAPNTAKTLSAAIPAHKKVKPGWVGVASYDVPSGIPALFLHEPCPTGEIAENGAFSIGTSDPSANSILLIGNAPRADVTPLYSEWAWTFSWPSGSAPSGTVITVNVYCEK